MRLTTGPARVAARVLAAGVALSFGACTAPVPPAPADLILRNGRIVTMDDAMPEARALASRGDRIVFVGSEADVQPHVGAATRIIDLHGQLAIPGFIDAHAHVRGIGERGRELDLRITSSWDEIVRLVAAAAKAAPPGHWIVGRGWHQDKWTSRPQPDVEGFPTHASLDAVSRDNPVVLTHASGHGVFVNARALALSGITRTTRDPAGGEILRDARGDPTGFLREDAAGLVRQGAGEPVPSKEASAASVREALRLASDEALARGITSLQDPGEPFDVVDRMKEAVDGGQVRVRLFVMVSGSVPELAANLDVYRVVGYGHDMLTVRAIKEYADGAMGSRGAWLLAPYADKPESTGLARPTLATLPDVARLAIDHGYQLAVHAIGDRANREVLNVFESAFAAAGRNGRDLRWRIEHAQLLDPADLPRFGMLGVIASMQPIHATSDGSWVVGRLGDARLRAGGYAWHSLLATGAVVAAGTDAPVEDVDPIPNYHAAVTRRLADGRVFYGGQVMTRMEALRAYTRAAAFAAFEEDRKGSLAPGKLADVTVLSKDITAVPEDEITTSRVIYTIVGGQVRYEGR